jgi:hypothetical protein
VKKADLKGRLYVHRDSTCLARAASARADLPDAVRAVVGHQQASIPSDVIVFEAGEVTKRSPFGA